MDENEKSSSCTGGKGAGSSTVDDDGLATTVTVGDDGLATITNGGIVTGVALVGTGGDTMVDDVDGAAGAVASVEDGIMIPLLADDADGAPVNGRISVDDADGALIDEGISVGEEHEVSVLLPIGGGVVDALASTGVPVGAGA